MLKLTHCIAAICLLLATGCAQTRYAWSPDGKHMTVIAGDGLHLADAAGSISPQSLAGVGLATWFADSQHLLVGREVQVGSWNELAGSLTAAQARMIEQAAGHARDAIFEYDWDDPDALADGRFLAFVKQRATEAHRDSAVFDRFTIPIAIYLKDHRDAALAAAAPGKWWQQVDALRQSVKHVEVYHLAGPKLALDATLMTTLADIADARPSPTGRNVLIATAAGQQACDLWVAPAKGKQPPTRAASGAAAFADWSPDGRQIAFIAAVSPDGNQITGGKLCRREVAGADGALSAPLPPRQELCDVRYMDLAKVRCLPDGRIVFTNGPSPGTPPRGGFIPAGPSGLFVAGPASSATAAQPLLPADLQAKLGDTLESFELNPAGSRLSVADSQGRVWAVDLASKQLRVVQGQSMQTEQNQPGLVSTPSWQSDDLLTLVAPAANGQAAVVDWSWSTQKTTPLSAGWPVALLPSAH